MIALKTELFFPQGELSAYEHQKFHYYFLATIYLQIAKAGDIDVQTGNLRVIVGTGSINIQSRSPRVIPKANTSISS